MELFVNKFSKNCKKMSGDELHTLMTQIQKLWILLSAIPCYWGCSCCMQCICIFLLGGGPIEMFCAFLGAGAGNFLRAKMNQHHLTYSCALRQALLWHVLYTQLPSMALEIWISYFDTINVGVIFILCYSLFQDFHLSQVELTYKLDMRLPDLNVWLTH